MVKEAFDTGRLNDVLESLGTILSAQPQRTEEIVRASTETYLRVGKLFITKPEFATLGESVCPQLKTKEPLAASIVPYLQYVDVLIRSPEESVDDLIQEFRGSAREVLSQSGALRQAMDHNPLIAFVSQHLLLELSREPLRLERIGKGWFENFLEDAEGAHEALDEWMKRNKQRAEVRVNRDDRQLVMEFMENFHYDLQRFISACINMATSLNCHSQAENCAVYMICTPFGIKGDRDSRKSFSDDLYKLKTSGVFANPHYAEAFGDVGTRNGYTEASIPNLVSVVDICKFMEFFSSFLQRLEYKPIPKTVTQWRSGAKTMTRPRQDAQGEARIRFSVDDPYFSDFNIRVDHTKRGIEIDIGGIDPETALEHALYLAQQSKDHEIVMSYDEILNNEGDIAHVWENTDDEHPTRNVQPYASVMLSPVLSPGEKAGLVAAGILSASKQMLFPDDRTFSYHFSGRTNTPDADRNFPAIARAIGQLR